MTPLTNDERLKRWRMVLGKDSECAGGASGAGEGLPCSLDGDDAQMDKVLQALYDSDRKAGLGSSSPNVNAGWETSARISPSRLCKSCRKTPSSV